jgi:hypothetical protein
MAKVLHIFKDIYFLIHNMDSPLPHYIEKIIKEWDPVPSFYCHKLTWESIEVPDDYEKPPKEEFEAKLQELVDAQPLKELRQERDRRLQAVDWVVIRATSTTTPVPEAWATYMQALRDLPATTEDPENPVWPPVPE